MKTDKDLYLYFLELINKEKTYTIVPSKFNLIINVGMINWVKSLLPETDYVQSRIDDLAILHSINELPITPIRENVFLKPDNFLRGIRAEFIVQYKNSPCFENGISPRIPPNLLKSDRVSAVRESYYTKPKDGRMYYRYIGKEILLLTGKDSGMSETVGKEMYLEYYRYPENINFEAGNEKVLEFGKSQLMTIAQQSAQEFLERNRDPRYQSYLQEQVIKNRI